MKFTLAISSLVFLGCLASEANTLHPQKRSVGLYDEIIRTPYGSSLDTSISSHTHTHTTSVIEKPIVISTATIPSTKFYSSEIPSSIYPAFGSYGWHSSYNYGLATTYSDSGKFYPSFGKYSSGYGWPTAYKKSYFTSSPIYKSYRW